MSAVVEWVSEEVKRQVVEQRERKLFQRDLALWEYRLAWKSERRDPERTEGTVGRGG